MAGRRSDHNREEFGLLVVDAAESIARQEGLRGLGLRRLATAIGYAPNSIYNTLGDLDEVLVRVNARTVNRLNAHLRTALPAGIGAREATLKLADAYLDFVQSDPRIWSLLFEHVLPPGRATPDVLQEALVGPTSLVDDVLAPLIGDAATRAKAVAALWASLHGLASLATSGKLSAVSRADPHELARLLVSSFLEGVGRVS